VADDTSLGLTGDEALVLFDFLSRYTDTEQLLIEDQAEQQVLWDMCAMLERELVEPVGPNYDELLAAARNRVRHKE
jgi:hypothetical protein